MERPNYENVAIIGQRVRAYDFEPFPGRQSYYIEGEVIDKAFNNNCPCYVVACDVDTSDILCIDNQARKGDYIYVPYRTLFDWEGRVTLV